MVPVKSGNRTQEYFPVHADPETIIVDGIRQQTNFTQGQTREVWNNELQGVCKYMKNTSNLQHPWSIPSFLEESYGLHAPTPYEELAPQVFSGY